MKKYGFMFVAMLAMMSVGLSSCKDDDNWTYFKNEETHDFEDEVGVIYNNDKDGYHWFRVATDIHSTLPTGGDEDGYVYVVRKSPEEINKFEGKRCIISGSYRKIKRESWEMGSVTYCDLEITSIAEYLAGE